MMLFEISTIDVSGILAGVLALVVCGWLTQRLRGLPHKLVIVSVSLAVILLLDWRSALILLAFAHLAYGAMFLTGTQRHVGLIAWGMVATLMTYKVVQSYGGVTTDWFTFLGVSYYTFRIASTLFDIGRGAIARPGYVDFMAYCLFFPIFAGGPVERYRHFARNADRPEENIYWGLLRLGRAAIKKILIADIVLIFLISWTDAQLRGSERYIVNEDVEGALKFGNSLFLDPFVALLLFGFLNILRAYFDLSAFTDLALGLARVVGYSISENFDRPFVARSIIEFWRRWHLTIAGWARDYVFSPLMLATRNLPLAVFLTMLAMGLWHEVSARWAFWGFCHGLGLVICGWWQRTAAYKTVQKREAGLKAKGASLVEQLGLPGQISGSLTACAGAAVSFAFFAPAWILNFGYMSLVFVAVSAPSFGDAMTMYKLGFWGRP